MKRGRPEFKPTAEMKRKAKQFAKNGLGQRDAARGLGISIETFRKYFLSDFLERSIKSKPAPVKTFKAKPAQRRRVERLHACGFSEQQIADAVGCDVSDLQGEFAKELRVGLAKYRADIIDNLDEVGKAGNVSALRTLEHLTALTPPTGDRPEKLTPLGKKQAADRDAKAPPPAGSGWDDLVPGAPPSGRPN